MLNAAVAEDLDELLEDGGPTAVAFLSEPCAVVVVAVDGSFMFVVGVGGAEDGRADGAGEMFNVVFAVECGDVRAAQGAAAGKAEEVEPSEVVGLAEWVLVRRLVGDGEEFRGDDFVAVLYGVGVSTMVSWQVREGIDRVGEERGLEGDKAEGDAHGK